MVAVEADPAALVSDVAALDADVAALDADVAALSADVLAADADVPAAVADVAAADADVAAADADAAAPTTSVTSFSSMNATCVVEPEDVPPLFSPVAIQPRMFAVFANAARIAVVVVSMVKVCQPSATTKFASIVLRPTVPSEAHDASNNQNAMRIRLPVPSTVARVRTERR